MESPVFEGHFPGHPLVPGVLLTETMAQASGYLVLGLMDFTHMPFLMAVDKARFRTFVGPRSELAVTAQLEHEGSGYAVTKAAIAVAGKRDLRRRAALPDHALPGRDGRRRCAHAGAADRASSRRPA